MSPKRDIATLRTQYRDVWCGRTHFHTPMKARLRRLSGRQLLFPLSSSPVSLPPCLIPEQVATTAHKRERRGGRSAGWGVGGPFPSMQKVCSFPEQQEMMPRTNLPTSHRYLFDARF